MAEIRREIQQNSGVKLGDILFALFKRKRTIIIYAALGIIAAAAVYFLYPPSYESQAKLLVRYVLERSGVDPVEADQLGSGHGSRPGSRSPTIAAAAPGLSLPGRPGNRSETIAA